MVIDHTTLNSRTVLPYMYDRITFPLKQYSETLFAYRESLRRSSGVTDFGRLGPFERFFPFGGLRSITRFLDSSDDVGR